MTVALALACTSGGTVSVTDGGSTTRPSDTADSAPPTDDETGAGTDCATRCDDGLDCSEDTCDGRGRCVSVPLATCPWPASIPPSVTELAWLDPSGDLQTSLSGATWDAAGRALWVVRGNGATAWRVVEDGAGGWRMDERWSIGDLDAESVVVVDPVGAPRVLHVLWEIEERVVAIDVSGPYAVQVGTWDTSAWLPVSTSLGAEGLAFVPDAALAAWGFVDGDGNPRTSALGMGGLFFVGHQNGGDLYVFDLEAGGPGVEHVGTYTTARQDTSGLEFDADTGRLYVWHGETNDLEVLRLSSSGAGGALDQEYLFDYPGAGNIEGIALFGLEDCGASGRPMVLATDDGDERALDLYPDWPLCRPE